MITAGQGSLGPAPQGRYIDTVLVTYCIPNSELKYNLSFRVADPSDDSRVKARPTSAFEGIRGRVGGLGEASGSKFCDLAPVLAAHSCRAECFL